MKKIAFAVIFILLALLFIMLGGVGVVFGILLILIAVKLFSTGLKSFSRKKSNTPYKVNDGIVFPKQLKNGQRLYKVYDHVSICVISGKEPNFALLHTKDKLEFRKEPTNRYDSRAIAVYDGKQRLGYLFRGTGQDMTHDFMDKGQVILARLQGVDIENGMLFMKVAYYRK